MGGGSERAGKMLSQINSAPHKSAQMGKQAFIRRSYCMQYLIMIGVFQNGDVDIK